MRERASEFLSLSPNSLFKAQAAPREGASDAPDALPPKPRKKRLFLILDIRDSITSTRCCPESMLERKTEYGIRHNARLKKYPDGHTEICISTKQIFRESGWEEVAEKQPTVRTKREMSEEEIAENLSRSQRRAKIAIRDICLCTEFTHFGTFTIAPNLEDRYSKENTRYSYDEIIKELNKWLSNMVQRKDFTYVFIPEFHKDGAIHFHGLFRGNMTLSPYMLSSLGKQQYNLAEWNFGYSLVEELSGSYEAAVNYCLKYITKESLKVGGRWYLSGGKLERPRVSLADLDINQLDGTEVFVPDAGMRIKYATISGD